MNDTWTVTVTYRDRDGMEYTKSALLNGEQMRRGYPPARAQISWQAQINHQEVQNLVEATRSDADRG